MKPRHVFVRDEIRNAIIEECVVKLADWYPDNSSTNAFCAALRSMKSPPEDSSLQEARAVTDILEQITSALQSDSEGYRDETLDAAYVEIVKLRAARSFDTSEQAREKVARAIHRRRYQMDAKDTDSMFAWYAENPKGADRSRMAIYSAYQDADAALSALSRPDREMTPTEQRLVEKSLQDSGTLVSELTSQECGRGNDSEG